MKRLASPNLAPANKRAKCSDPIKPTSDGDLDGVSEQSLTDMLHHGVDEARCITGVFKMTWSLSSKIEAVALIRSTTAPENEEHVLKMYFELDGKYLPMLDLSPLDEFRLLLRGAELRKAARIPPLCTSPFQLVFSKGMHIVWKPKGPGLKNITLNTWLMNDLRRAGNDSWYCSQDEQHTWPKLRELQEDEENVHVPADTEAVPDAKLEAKQSKKLQRMEAKRQKQEAKLNAERAIRPKEINMGELPNAINAEDNASNDSTRASPASAKDSKFASKSDVTADAENPSRSSSQKPDAASNFKAGFRSGSDVYPALSGIRHGQFAKLAGIVTDISEPKQTRTGDFMCYVQIVDPSNYYDSGSGRPQGIKINCFTKRYPEWLPHPERGEAIILRDVKVVDYNGAASGTGFHNKLRWVAFSPSKGEIHHGVLNKAPREEGLGDGGFGAIFSPFFQPGSAEIAYCIGLSDWWREMAEKDASDSVMPGGNFMQPTQRVHRLISDAGPMVPPDGYFDCTVEILKVFTNSNMVHTVYATDYTRSKDMVGSQSNAWPASLSEYVLQFEMWDRAARIAEEMHPGQYYFIKNARMRINSAGHVEGKVAQDKIVLLDEDDAAADGHLKGLLERKRAWEAKQVNSEPEIIYQLIQDVKEGKFFNCTVELLHAVCKPNQMPHVFVTDYTAHPSLEANSLNEPWSAGLEGRIVKLLLSEEQTHLAESPQIGSFYAIKKLRLKYSPVEDCFCGTLGGHEKLMTVLNPKRIDNEHLNGLVRRKEEWTRCMRKQRQQSVKKDVPQEVAPAQLKGNHPFRRVKDMPLLNWDVGRYRLFAKVVDFYPLKLRDAFYQQCVLCQAEIPNRQKACFKCGDYDREHVQYVYRMFIEIQDEDGEQIKISINDKCPLLAGLKRAHLQDDKAALDEFCNRVDPLVGSLVAMHDDLLSGKTVDLDGDTPILCFELDSWVIAPEAIRAFSLYGYELVP